MNKPNRALSIDGLVSARDLGGLKRSNGTVTPYGVFYRAENLDLVSLSGWNQLKSSGIRTVVDLRQKGEVDQDSQSRPAWLNVIHIDLDNIENKKFWEPYLKDGLESTSMYYLNHLKAMPEQSAKVLEMIVTAPEGGVLFHCKSGRDRTGLIALLLLSAVDTKPDEIIDDYLETVRLGEVRGKRISKDNPELKLEQLLQKHGTSTEGSFRNAVERFKYSDFICTTTLSQETIHLLQTWRGSIKII